MSEDAHHSAHLRLVGAFAGIGSGMLLIVFSVTFFDSAQGLSKVIPIFCHPISISDFLLGDCGTWVTSIFQGNLYVGPQPCTRLTTRVRFSQIIFTRSIDSIPLRHASNAPRPEHIVELLTF